MVLSVFILVVLSFVVFYFLFCKTSVETATKYTKSDILDGLYGDLQPVARVLNALYDYQNPTLHPNIEYVNFLVGGWRPAGACEIEVSFENLNNKIPSDEEMHKLAFKIRKIVEDFFAGGLLLPDDKSKERFFKQSVYSQMELSSDNKFYYKEILPAILCKNCLKYRLKLLTFITRFKYNDRVFYSDFFGVSSSEYEQAMAQFDRRYKEYNANKKYISDIESELRQNFPALKSYFDGSFYWLKKAAWDEYVSISNAITYNRATPTSVFYGMLLIQVHLQITLAKDRDLFGLWDYLLAKAKKHNSFPEERLKEMSAAVNSEAVIYGKDNIQF